MKGEVGSSVAGRVSVPSRGLGLGKKMISRRDAKPPREEEESHSHEIHGNHERGEASESAASAVVFLSASGWAWVEGKPPILLEEAEDLSQRHQGTKGG